MNGMPRDGILRPLCDYGYLAPLPHSIVSAAADASLARYNNHRSGSCVLRLGSYGTQGVKGLFRGETQRQFCGHKPNVPAQGIPAQVP